MKDSRPNVSIVVPLFNEAAQINSLLQSLLQVIQASDYSFEIILVDDGSSDGSAEAIERARREHPDLIMNIAHPYNKGNGSAVRTGIRHARGELVVCMDADGQHDPRHIPELLAHFPPYDLVVGARNQLYSGGWRRNLANRVFNTFATWLTGFKIGDLTSGFRVFRRQAIRPYLPLFPRGFSYPVTSTLVMLRAGYNLLYVPIEVLPRQSGESKIHLWRDGTRFIVIILRIIMLYNPLRIFVPISFATLLLGVVLNVIAISKEGRIWLPNSAVLFYAIATFELLLGLMASQIVDLKHIVRDDGPFEYPTQPGDR